MGYQLQTSDDLLTAIKRDSYIASSQGNFDDSQMLAVADKMIIETIVPLLKSLDSGWYLSYHDFPLVSTTDRYDISRYAMYGMLHRVCLIDTRGVEMGDMTYFTNSDDPLYRTGTSGTPDGYEIIHNQLRMNRVPRDSDVSSYMLRQYIYRRPGRLVKVAASATIASYATPLLTYTAAAPATFLSGLTYDFYAGRYPFVRRESAQTATTAGTTTQNFVLPTTYTPVAGDVVTLQDETIYPDVPDGFMGYLASLVALSMARSKSDAAQFQVEQGRVVENMRNALSSAPGDRIKGRKRKLSLLNSGLVTATRRRFMVDD